MTLFLNHFKRLEVNYDLQLFLLVERSDVAFPLFRKEVGRPFAQGICARSVLGVKKVSAFESDDNSK